jgi:hypothetical protein
MPAVVVAVAAAKVAVAATAAAKKSFLRKALGASLGRFLFVRPRPFFWNLYIALTVE